MSNQLTFSQVPQSSSFEIELVVRDFEGNPTGQTRSFVSDNPYKVWEFYQRQQGKPKRKHKKSRGIPNAEQTQKLLVEAAAYAENKQVVRDNSQNNTEKTNK